MVPIIITQWLENNQVCSNYIFTDFYVTMQGVNLLVAQQRCAMVLSIVLVGFLNYKY